MRDRIAPLLYPGLPLLIVAVVWLYGDARRLEDAQRQAECERLPTQFRNAVALQGQIDEASLDADASLGVAGSGRSGPRQVSGRTGTSLSHSLVDTGFESSARE